MAICRCIKPTKKGWIIVNVREKVARMMYGRYGIDALSKGMLYVSIAMLVINMFFHNRFLNAISMVLLFLCYIRMFSRNFAKRQQENMKFMNICNRVKYQFSKISYRIKESKTHHIYRCPKCKQKIRVPRGKGKISIRCPKCQNEFIKHS